MEQHEKMAWMLRSFLDGVSVAGLNDQHRSCPDPSRFLGEMALARLMESVQW